MKIAIVGGPLDGASALIPDGTEPPQEITFGPENSALGESEGIPIIDGPSDPPSETVMYVYLENMAEYRFFPIFF